MAFADSPTAMSGMATFTADSVMGAMKELRQTTMSAVSSVVRPSVVC
jgi:hypothetical protein